MLSTAELAAIADLGVPVIFDEVYQALELDDGPAPTLALAAPGANDELLA